MRIGIDVTSCLNSRGYGRFSRGLLGALLTVDSAHEFVLLSDRQTAERVELPAGGAEWVVASTRQASVDAAAHASSRSLGDMWSMASVAARQRLDAMFFPTVYTFFPVLSRTRVIVGIHDVIPEDHPQLVFPQRGRRLMWSLKSRLARLQADFIMTVSEHSKRGIQRHFGWDPARVWVVGEAPDPIFRPLPAEGVDDQVLRRQGLEAGDRFVIYVGGINPHKNLGAVLTALAKGDRQREMADVKLVVVGETESERFTPGLRSLRERIVELSLEDRVRFTGFLADEDLVHLLNRSQLLVLPSMAEGYGLPAVEAAACGTPVVATRNSPLPEILEGGGVFVDPSDTEALASAMARVLSSEGLRRDLGVTALGRARDLSWRSSADQMNRLFAAVESTFR